MNLTTKNIVVREKLIRIRFLLRDSYVCVQLSIRVNRNSDQTIVAQKLDPSQFIWNYRPLNEFESVKTSHGMVYARCSVLHLEMECCRYFPCVNIFPRMSNEFANPRFLHLE